MNENKQMNWSPYFEVLGDEAPQSEEFMSEVMTTTFNHLQELLEDGVITSDGMEDAAAHIFPVVLRLLGSTFVSEVAEIRFDSSVPIDHLLVSEWPLLYPFTDEEQEYTPVDYMLGRVDRDHWQPTLNGIEFAAELMASFTDTLELHIVELAVGLGLSVLSPQGLEVETNKRAVIETGGYIFIKEDGIYGAFRVVEPGDYEITELV